MIEHRGKWNVDGQIELYVEVKVWKKMFFFKSIEKRYLKNSLMFMLSKQIKL